jgi:tetratricopeptide (TPR) repeat protein
MADLSPELAAKIQTLEGGYADNPGRYFVALAGAWREAGEIGRAEEILRENLKRFPGLSAHVLLGRCLADRGAFQEAANEFHYVLSIDAQNLIALRTLAEMAAAGGRRAEAERWYNELLAVDPMNAEARASLAELSRAGADASVADQPVQVGTGWGGAAEPAPVAGGADAGGAGPEDGEFGMIDLAAPDASPADASGVAADDDAEWGDLPLELADEPHPSTASAPAGDFDAFGFGSVQLDAPADDADAWAADARQDLGESAAADHAFGADEDDTLLNAPVAGADLPFLDPDDTVAGHDLPLLDAGATVPGDDLPLLDTQATPEFGGFDAHADAEFSPYTAADPGTGLPPLDHGADDPHVDHEVDAEVVTETMAELYAAQGLLQQSADTYRELIRQRGEEPGLVRRLAEIEARLHPAAESAVPAPAADEPAEEETPDWLASVDAFAMGGAAASMAAIHMSADEPEPEPEAEPLAPADDVFDTLPPSDAYEPVSASADASHDASAGPDSFEAEPGTGFDFPAAGEFDAPSTPGFDYLTPAAAAAAGADSFAESFRGGFEGTETETPAHAFAAPVAEFAAADDRAPWEAPAVAETEPVGFDLIVVEEDGDEVPAPPEVVADVSADWAIAAAPLEDDEEAAEEAAAAAPAGSSTMRAYFTGLLSWQPGQSAAAPAAVEEPAFTPAPTFEAPSVASADAEEEQWAETPAAPVADEQPWSAAPAPSDAEEEPWSEAPAAPTADEPWSEAPAAPTADEPWSEAPAAPTADEPWSEVPAPAPADEPAYDLPAGAEPADEPWAAPSSEAAPASEAPDVAAADDLPLMDLGDEPWSAPRAPAPAPIDAFTLADDIAPAAPAGEPAAASTDEAEEEEEALPWELPVGPSPTTAEQAPAADAGGGFSFEDFFAGGPPAAAETPIEVEPEPEPVRETEVPDFVPSLAFEPAPATPPAPVTPAASAPAASAPAAGGQEEEDEDLESFQAWLQSLKR